MLSPVEILFLDKINGCRLETNIEEVEFEDTLSGWDYEQIENKWIYLKSYSKYGLENCNIYSLKELLRNEKLKVSGKRDELIARLESRYNESWWEWRNYFKLKYGKDNKELLDSLLRKEYLEIDKDMDKYMVTRKGKAIIEKNESVFYFDRYINVVGNINITEYYSKSKKSESYKKILISLIQKELEYLREEKIFGCWEKILKILISIYENSGIEDKEIEARLELYSLGHLSTFGYKSDILFDSSNVEKLKKIYPRIKEIGTVLSMKHLLGIGFLDIEKDSVYMAGIPIPISKFF